MTERNQAIADLWAWARESSDDPTTLDTSGLEVQAVLVTKDGARWLPRLLEELDALAVSPHRLVAVDAGSIDSSPDLLARAHEAGTLHDVIHVDAEVGYADAVAQGLTPGGEGVRSWVWLLHDDAQVESGALERLLRRALAEDAPGVVAPLLLHAQRHGVGQVIAEAGQTVAVSGVVTSPVSPGVLDQGQIEGRSVLGASTCGLLVRRDVWDALGGLNPDVPPSMAGLDLCWRARAAGNDVVLEPTARLRHWEASGRGWRTGSADDPLLERRRWGMVLDEAYGGGRFSLRERLAVLLATVGRMLFFLLGKDLPAAGAEAKALRAWNRDRSVVSALRARFADAREGRPSPEVGSLRPSRRRMFGRVLDEISGRFSDWAASFGAHGPELGLDTLTGDDYSGNVLEFRATRWAPWAVALLALVVGAVAAARHLFGFAPLSGPQLLPSPAAFGDLLAGYVNPIAGAGASAGAPWQGLWWLASLITLGHPDVLVGLVVLAGVPLGFLLARRTLLELVGDPSIALVGGIVWGLLPVVVGAAGSGQLGVMVFALLLPELVHSLVTWRRVGDPSWQRVGAFVLAVLVMSAFIPLVWPLAVVLLIAAVWGRATPWFKTAFAAVAPALLYLTPWASEVLRAPGRLLTSSEPLLAPTAAPEAWHLLLGRPESVALPALWVSAVVFGALWVAAIIGLVRRPDKAGWGLAVAGLGAVIAVGLTRVVVPVPPAAVVRPQATEWVLVMAAGLLLAAAWGLDGLAEEMRGQTFGGRHVLGFGVAALATVGVLVAGGAWVASGLAPLERRDVGSIPPFMAKDQARGATRTFVLDSTGERLSWALTEGTFTRLGDAERGLVYSGDATAAGVASSVASRLASGTADDRIAPDLASLGVGYVWMAGENETLKVSTSNTPGLGTASGDKHGMSWQLPTGGRVLVVAGTEVTRVAPGDDLAPPKADSKLVLAEPADPRWRASVGGVALDAVASEDGRQTFALPTTGGRLELALDSGTPWWAWAQLVLFLGLIGLALPSVSAGQGSGRLDARRRGARRMEEKR